MFVAVYEFTVKSDLAQRFRQEWVKTTQGIYQEYGSLGSRLHTTNHLDVYIGYAQWPTREQWASEKNNLTGAYFHAWQSMRECIESVRVLHEMEVCDDYLQTNTFVPDQDA